MTYEQDMGMEMAQSRLEIGQSRLEIGQSRLEIPQSQPEILNTTVSFGVPIDPASLFLQKSEPMLLSTPRLSLPFMPIQPVDPPSILPPSFMSDPNPHIDPFAMLESSIPMDMTPENTIAQAPSPSLHGSPASYTVGVTSSLESALGPAALPGGRSRADTSISPTNPIPPSFPSLPTPQLPAFSPPTEAKQEDLVAVTQPRQYINHLFKNIANIAVDAQDAFQNHHSTETNIKVDQLKSCIEQVCNMIALVSVGEQTPLLFPPVNPPSAIVAPVPELSTGFSSAAMAAAPVENANHLTISDQSRKRCASELEVHRSVKALKREPQEDIPLSIPIVEPIPASDPFPAPLPHPLTVLSQSSRPPSPSMFSHHGPFSSTNQQQPPNFSTFIPGATAALDLSPPLVAGAESTFPPLQSSWSDPVVPTTRHQHSLSAGSIVGPPALASNSLDAFSAQMQPIPQPLASNSAIGPPVGRMSRSGSINGPPPFPSSFNYGYRDAFADPGNNWPTVARVSKPPAVPTSKGWYFGSEPTAPLVTSPSNTSDGLSTVPSTAQNSPPSDEEDEDGSESDGSEHHPGRLATHNSSSDAPTSHPSTDVPSEYRAEVDRIFFEYLNKICSNLDATDSKGDHIHQTLMAKKMQRLDESPDFRPFKFRIQAFTTAFLEELARQGYPEEKIPMKKIRNYLWRQQYILRFNEDGKKAKSKGNHIWNIEAKKAGDGKWEFRPFHRKLAGTPPGVAYCGLRWTWTPRIWDPQAASQNFTVQYSSPHLPSWLMWKDDQLTGVPPLDAENCQITVVAKFVVENQECQLTHSFNLTVAPTSSIDPSFSRSRRPSLAGDPPRRSTSDSALFQAPQRAKRPAQVLESPDTRVKRVLENVAQRVTEEAESQFVSTSPPTQGAFQDLVKQKHVLEQTVDAYDKEITGHGHSQTRRLAVAAQNVVVQAAHRVIADRTVATGGIPTQQSETTAMQSVTVGELTDATQDAIATAVKRNGTASTEVDIIVAATSILKARTPILDIVPSSVQQQPRPLLPGAGSTRFAAGTNLSPLPEYV